MVPGIKQFFDLLKPSTAKENSVKRNIAFTEDSFLHKEDFEDRKNGYEFRPRSTPVNGNLNYVRGQLLKTPGTQSYKRKRKYSMQRGQRFFSFLSESCEFFTKDVDVDEVSVSSTSAVAEVDEKSDDTFISCGSKPDLLLQNATGDDVCSKFLGTFSQLIKERVPVASSCEDLRKGSVNCLSCLKRQCLRPQPCQIKFSSTHRPNESCLNSDYGSSDEEGGCDQEKPNRKGYYEIERILAVKNIEYKTRTKVREKKFYYIKWFGWSHRFDSWEPKSNLGRVSWIMEEFEAREKALACIVKDSSIRISHKRLRQLRNLDRWETEINNKLKEARMKRLYVYNDVNEGLRPKNFQYIVENMLSKEMEGMVNSASCHFCNCDTKDCGKFGICCPAHENYRVFYTKQGYLKHEYSREQGKIVECNSRCKCDSKCPTKIIQRGRRSLVAIAQTEKCGWGVFALEDIRANRFVVEYVGEVLSVDEARKRKDPYYQFEVGEDGNITYVIDAKNYGNESAFVNHSCQPNLVAIPIYVERMIPGYHRIGFFTITDVKRGEELTLDYFNNPLEESKYIRDEDGIKCQCGAECCKGYFPQVMNDDLSPKKKSGKDDVTKHFSH